MTEFSIPARRNAEKVSEADRLYAVWRYSKAQWDLAVHNPKSPFSLTDEETNAHCDRTCAALNEYLIHPASNAKELALKLRVFEEEEIIDNWTRGAEIVAQLVKDAELLAGWGKAA